MGNVNITEDLKVGGKIEGIGIVPIGAVVPYFGTNTPEGWLFCDGSQFDINIYPELYNVLGKSILPNIADGRFLEGAVLPNVPQDASLPNIKGEVSIKGIDASRLYIDHNNNEIVKDANNALYGGGSESSVRVGSYDKNDKYKQNKTLVFDASKYNSVYNDDNIMRPMSITTRFIIRAR